MLLTFKASGATDFQLCGVPKLPSGQIYIPCLFSHFPLTGCSSVCVCVCWPVHWSRISIICPIYFFFFNSAGSISKEFYEWISEIFCSQSWIQKFAISIEISSGWHFLVELPLLKHTCNQQGNCPRIRQASAVSSQDPTMTPQQAPAVPRYPVRWEAGGVCTLQQGVTHFITRFFLPVLLQDSGSAYMGASSDTAPSLLLAPSTLNVLRDCTSSGTRDKLPAITLMGAFTSQADDA